MPLNKTFFNYKLSEFFLPDFSQYRSMASRNLIGLEVNTHFELVLSLAWIFVRHT